MPTIDLSQLPAPEIIENIDYEILFNERIATLISLYPEEEQDAVAHVLSMETDPMVKILQENAYREVILRQRVNEAAQAVMVAYAIASDLDNLAANNNVRRRVITPADNTTTPPTPAVMESDVDLRQRIPAAFEGMSVAGPVSAYEYHALSADGRVSDAAAFSPAPSMVTVAVLARTGDGSAPAELLSVVSNALNDKAVRPVADRVSVVSAEIINYSVEAILYVYPGPAKEPILAAARKKLTSYIKEQRRLGRDIRRSAIYAALHVQGVQRVELEYPKADVVLDKSQAAFCTSANVVIGGSDE